MTKVEKDEKETNDKTKKKKSVIHKIGNRDYGFNSSELKHYENIPFWNI